jgi:hypothetical protein
MGDVGPFAHRIRDEKVPPDRMVAVLAERQHGVVARRQLAELGLGRGAIHRRMTAGRLHRIHAGVYAVGYRRLSVHGRWMAAVLACGPTALLSHRSAAALLGLLLTSGSLIDVASPGRTRHKRPGVALHRPRELHAEDRAVRDRIPVTSVARTLLDLGHVVQPRQMRRAIDEAERLGLFDLRAVERLIGRAQGHPGLRHLEVALRQYSGPPPPTRSELERRFLDLCAEAGLPRPQVNVLVQGLEVDVLWSNRRLIVELDGYAFHHDRASFEEDRKRDAALNLAGYRVLRITDRRLHREPGMVVDMIRALLGART